MKHSKLLQKVMSQRLLVVGDRHVGDENDHLVESEATMDVVFDYIRVLHDSDYKYRLWLETGNTYEEALTNLGYGVNHIPLKCRRPAISEERFDKISKVYEKIRKHAFVDNGSNKKTRLINEAIALLSKNEIQTIKYWIQTFVTPIEDEAIEICKQEKPDDVIDIIVIGNIHAHYLSMLGYPVRNVEDDELCFQYAFINKILRNL